MLPLIRAILAFGLLFLCCVGVAWAQGGQTGTTAAEAGQHTPAISYAVALLSSIVIMVIVCTPSRKR
jgi:hypothetical protein